MTVGILGGGQLGRMLALAGLPLGQRFRVLDLSADAVAGHVSTLQIGSHDDEAALRELAAACDVITYEHENVPVSSAAFLSTRTAVYPPPRALEVSQDRLIEKQFFAALGIPTVRSRPVATFPELAAAVADLGLPAVVKRRRFGYDGKGQHVVRAAADVENAWESLRGADLIVEAWAPFERELSILAVRGRHGELAFYPLVENEHRRGILQMSRPTAVGERPLLQAQAERYARSVLEELAYVGVLTIEFFCVDGALVANEMAPRVHNSGHWTLEGAETSQFENHVRAMLGMPLGSTRMVGFSAMINCIGKLPRREDVLAIEGAHLHAYGKDGAPGRKVGHVTVRAQSREELAEKLVRLVPIVDAHP